MPDVRAAGAIGALAVALVVAAAGRAGADARVDVTATDGAQLVGVLAGTDGPGVVLAHGADADRGRWDVLADTLVAAHYRVLRLDLRGHGESPGPRDVGAADRDVEGAYRYLLGRKIRPVFLVGTGVGGTAAIAVAGRVPVAGVAVLGAPPAGEAADVAKAIAALRVPVLVVDHEPSAFPSLPPSARRVVVPDGNPIGSPGARRAVLELLAGASPGDAARAR